MNIKTETIKNNDFYRTTDMALAVVLSLFYPIEAIDRQNPRKVQFLFSRDKNLDQLVESYWRGDIKVEPQAYFNQIRIVKARLYGEEN